MDNQPSAMRTPGLSGSALKVIATLAMFIDHGTTVMPPDVGQTVILQAVGNTLTLYVIMRAIGRIAFPLFCFLLVEGFDHTHDRKAYAIRLAIFAAISEIPWNLWHSGSPIMPEKQSVYVTLLTAFLGLCILERIERSKEPRERGLWSLLLLLFYFAVHLVRCDYGARGITCVLAIKLLQGHFMPQAIVTGSCTGYPIHGTLALISVAFYNGERGFIRGRILQLLFYAIYPLHMLLLWYIRFHVFL